MQCLLKEGSQFQPIIQNKLAYSMTLHMKFQIMWPLLARIVTFNPSFHYNSSPPLVRWAHKVERLIIMISITIWKRVFTMVVKWMLKWYQNVWKLKNQIDYELELEIQRDTIRSDFEQTDIFARCWPFVDLN